MNKHPDSCFSVGLVLMVALGVGCAGGSSATKAPPPSTDSKAQPSTPAPASTAAAEPVQVQADATRTLPSGTTVPVPAKWFVTQAATKVTLEEPDHEARIVVVEHQTDKAADAIANSWQAVQPGFSRNVLQTLSPPPDGGLDEVMVVRYATTTAESRSVLAVCKRKGNLSVVVLVDGTNAVMEKRGAQVNIVAGGIKLPGATAEDLKATAPQALQGDRLKSFETFTEQAFATAKIPGASLVVVQDGKVVYQKGLGVRSLGKPDPVTPDTLMMIGSVTKSMTTLMMGTLVDEGKFGWDTKVTSVMPTFELGSPEATGQLTMKHLVCACTGMPRRDMELIFEFGSLTPEKLIADLKTTKPTTGFGETFQYSNQMVAAAGFVAASLLSPGKPVGDGYDAAMQARVFGPMGMKATTLSFERALKNRDRAMPHGHDLNHQSVPINVDAERFVVPLRPSGGVWSSANDMARYVLTELGRGVAPDGKRVVSEANLTKRWEPQVKASDNAWYGLGWGINEMKGVRTVAHSGGTFGFNSYVVFWPDKGFGAVILTNTKDGGAFISAVRNRLFELVVGGKEEAAEKLAFTIKARDEQIARELKKVDSPDDPAWIKPWAGTYKNADLGTLVIKVGKNKKDNMVDVGEWTSGYARKVEDDGAVNLVLAEPPVTGGEFLLKEKDGQRTLLLDVGQAKYEFVLVKGK